MKKIIFSLFVLAPALAPAQFKTNVVCEGEMVYNPAITINKKDLKNFIIASAEGIYYSIDEGTTWQKSQVETKGTAEHRVISDRKGEIYDFYLALNSENKRFDKIVCQSSRDGGATWQLKGTITAPGKDIRNTRVSIYNKSGELMLTWTQYDQYGSEDPQHKSNIMYAQSKEGKKWSSASQVNQLSGDSQDRGQSTKGAMPGINSREMMFVVWAMNQAFYIDRSFNKGATWLTNDIHITNEPGGWSYQVPGLNKVEGLPDFLVDNSTGRYSGALFLSWADQRNGANNTDIWFLRSVNFGDNWSTPLRVNDDDDNRHQYMPAMTIDQADGSIYIVFFDRRNYEDNQTDVYLAYSNDNGASFKNIKISGEPLIPVEEKDFGTYISIDAHQGTIIPAWTTLKEGKIVIQTTVIKRDELFKVAADVR